MRAQTFTKFGIGLVAVTLATCTLAVPASADPASGKFGTLVGTGSDTTQDLVNGLSTAIGGPNGVRIASYDATGGATITTRDGGNTFPRPNGSGNGRDVLRVAIGQSTLATATINGVPTSWTSADVAGNVDFARSSSGAGAGDIAANGVLTYIPFAKDAVTYGISSNSAFPTLTLGAATDAVDPVTHVGPSTLFAIYGGKVTRIITSASAATKLVDDAYVLASGETSTPIHALVPQAGSGTRSFWLGKVGLVETDITGGKVPVLDTFGAAKTPVQEHDGTALQGDAGAIVPFSIGQWVAQGNGIEGVADRRHGAVLGSIGTQTPTVGTVGNYELNPAFTAITRTVYNIVPSSEADDADSKTNWAFVGTGSLICSQKDVIKRYGFGLLTGTGANSCGDTSIRAYAPSLSTVSLDVKSSVKYGSSFALKASVVSNNNGGGTVSFFNGETELATVKLAKGETVANATYKTTSATTIADLDLVAQFTPTLSGVGEDDSEPVAVDVQVATASVKGTAASVKANKAPVVKVAVTATGSVKVAGKVTIKEGSKTLKSNATLGSTGKVNVTLPKLKKGTHKLVISYAGSSTVAAGKSSTITLKIK